jgi:hypothetical protein
MEGFKKLSKVDPSFPEPKSHNKIKLASKVDEAGFVVDIVEEDETKGYWEAVNGPNGQV